MYKKNKWKSNNLDVVHRFFYRGEQFMFCELLVWIIAFATYKNEKFLKEHD